MENSELIPTAEDAVFQITSSPNYKEDKIMFAARRSGLYRSSDSGQSWHYSFKTLDLQDPLSVTAIALSPNFGEDGQVFAAVPGGILRSDDGGNHWTVSMLPSPAPFISALAISPDYARDGTLFAGTIDDGIFRSANRGASWTGWNFGLFDIHILSLAISPDFYKDKTVFLGTESCIFISKNGGLGWRELNFPLDRAPVISLALSPDFSRDGEVFAGTEGAGLYHTSDFGKTWELIAQEDRVGAVNTIILSSDYPNSGRFLIANLEEILFTADRGRSWKPLDVKAGWDVSIMCVAAPEGLGQCAKILIGLSSGDIIQKQEQP